MFDWLFKKLQLDPPKSDRKQTEKKRVALLSDTLKITLSDKDAQAIFDDMSKHNFMVKGIGKLTIIPEKDIDEITIPWKFPSGIFETLPGPVEPTRTVPLCDYQIIKIIRQGWALGEGTIQIPIEESGYSDKDVNKAHYNNAQTLHKYYGMSKDEIFQLTGCLIED